MARDAREAATAGGALPGFLPTRHQGSEQSVHLATSTACGAVHPVSAPAGEGGWGMDGAAPPALAPALQILHLSLSAWQIFHMS